MRSVKPTVCALTTILLACTNQARQLVLVDDGVSRAPIVVFEDAPPKTRQAAEELGDYIEKISGARPKLIEGKPEPIPDHAIWVGYQPVLDEWFPDLDFEFEHQEEVLIAANEDHLVIAGRDRWDEEHLIVEGRNRTIEGWQREYGTANAVYTFLQDHLDVRWIMPGEFGVDFIETNTIALEPFEYRHHPPFLERAAILRFSRLGDTRRHSHDWVKFQRLQLDSMSAPGGHPASDWWEKYHEDHPDYFALQPDGTRSGFPRPENAKRCLSNPAVWNQWLDEVEQALKEDPNRTVFGANENDSHSSGICVCEDCRAWDPSPEETEARRSYRWAETGEEYVPMSDRYVRFANALASKLKERYPDRDDLYVQMSTYGPASPPPVEAEPAENVIVSVVGHFPLTTPESRREQKGYWKQWAQKAAHMRYRPNLWYWGGGLWGWPEVAMTRTIEDFTFLAENGAIGMFVDGAWEHWATQGPMYYLMAQLAWDPDRNGEAIMRDYYRRGFGKAAEQIEAYWTMMERANAKFMASPDLRLGSAGRFTLIKVAERVYSPDLMERADRALEQAGEQVAAEPERYQRRVAFVRDGFDFFRMMIECIPLMERVRESEGRDTEAVRQASANWARITEIAEETSPHGFWFDVISSRMQGGYMGGMADYLGPPSEAFREAAEVE